MKICIRPHDVGKASSFELGKKINEMGFDGVQLAIAKAIEGQSGSPETLTEEVAKEITKGFTDNNVDVALLGAYFNPVHSNEQKVKDGAAKYADHLKKAHLFGTKYVASETGSYNDDKWTYNPKNQTDSALAQVTNIFKPLVETAKEYDSFAVVEGAWGHCMFSPEQMLRLFKNIDNGHMRLTLDLYNYLYTGNYEKRFEIFDTALDLFNEKIVVFHIKDFLPTKDEETGEDKLVQVQIGTGIMGWDILLPKIKKLYPNGILVFEGVKNPIESLAFVKKNLI
ncbi:MAG: sugar phosphate isomerase/epimerase [Treponema sp.]|nr:sugar phosphate isomerase/epimerase [Treponema sp.]